MFLKALTLKGFKSFAEATTIEFEPGVTVVVGPNGSGKSNVVDAVAWVMGAQGPKTVRSSRMDDVIFAGSSSRPALGRAEVSLVIDNSAGRLPIGLSEVTITRTLFRSGDSEYAINGAACRLLDVQELLSDSGVGRQQHLIVGQGQLDGVLSARPEDRRLMVEEAAGVLKYRRRREKAERRLEATEGNLLRLQDLLREVRRQLRPLERQADAARRHSGLEAELRGLRLYLAGRELEALRRRTEASRELRQQLAEEEAGIRRRLASLDSSVLALEHDLGDMRSAEESALLARIGRLSERAKGLRAVLAERERSLQEARRAVVDKDVVASLVAEEEELRAELAAVDDEGATLGEEESALRQLEAAARSEIDSLGWAGAGGAQGDVAGITSAVQVRSRIALLRHGLERDRAEEARLLRQAGQLEDRGMKLGEERVEIEHELREARASLPQLRERVELGSRRATAATDAARAAAAEARNREEAQHRAEARWEALASAGDPDRELAAAGRTEEAEGILGVLEDLVEVDGGFELAFEAAVQGRLRALVAQDSRSARDLLSLLLDSGTARGVLVVPSATSSGFLAGVRTKDEDRGAPAAGADPLRPRIRAASAPVASLLDELLAGVAVVRGGWEAALELHLRHPDLVAVTIDGARFARDGWHSLGGGSKARLAEVRRAELDAAEARSKSDLAARASEVARGEEEAARQELAAANRALENHRAQIAAAERALARLEDALGDDSSELQRVWDDLALLRARISDDASALEDLERALPGLESEEAEQATARREARARLDERLRRASQARSELAGRAARLEERRFLAARRLDEIARRLGASGAGGGPGGQRRAQLEDMSSAVERLSVLVDRRLAWLDEALARAEAESRHRHEELSTRSRQLEGLRSERAQAEHRLAQVRERSQRAEIEAAELHLRDEAAIETVRRDLEAEPEEAMSAPLPELPEGALPATRARELEQELRAMGPVNPLAVEELGALVERHDLIESQLEDVRSARRELSKIIRAIDAEIVDVFAAAYADVADHFAALFSTLFPGGSGQLRLADPSDLLETGIEIEARPAGRNVRKLSLLSGGERSLVALAFLFAIFRSRPSPFYVMDEVEAALDDVNLHRFLELVNEFRDEAQLIVVSHQKRTMEAADALVGVTMQAGGTSRILSERAVPAVRQPA